MAAKARKSEILLGSPQVISTANSSWSNLGASRSTGIPGRFCVRRSLLHLARKAEIRRAKQMLRIKLGDEVQLVPFQLVRANPFENAKLERH
jgi:hypothetical protein